MSAVHKQSGSVRIRRKLHRVQHGQRAFDGNNSLAQPALLLETGKLRERMGLLNAKIAGARPQQKRHVSRHAEFRADIRHNGSHIRPF